MGNLYTHITKHTDKRLNILSRLKIAYRSSPRNYGEIQRLQKELKDTETKGACSHPFVRKTSFGARYCPSCQKNI